jgi:hypothetical protein
MNGDRKDVDNTRALFRKEFPGEVWRLMRMKRVCTVLVYAVALVFGVSAVAQEGHPLKGTWYGDFGTESERHDLTVVMDWDGREVTGVVHPGPNAIPIKSVVMDITPAIPAEEGENSTTGTPPVFEVRFEVDVPNVAGGTDSFVFEGRIFNPVPSNRRIAGTWTCDGETGSFQIRRL